MRAAKLRTRILQVDPERERRRYLMVAVVALLLAGGGFLLGRELATPPVVPLEDATAPLRQEITRLTTRAAVDRETLNALRLELADARSRVDELQRELVFYRGVMAPEEQGAPLLLREPTLLPVGEPGEWRYQLVVQQGTRSDVFRKGDLEVLIAGQQDGREVSWPLGDLDEALAVGALPLGFRYFQKFEGTIRLPSGFVPQAIELKARLEKPGDTVLERTFPWPVVDTPPVSITSENNSEE